MLQYRPTTADPNRLWYNPARDLANVGINIINGGVQRLDCLIEQTEVKKLLIGNGISEEIVESAFNSFIKALESIKETKNWNEAMAAAEFGNQPLLARLLILSAIGDAFIDATIICVKDLTESEIAFPLTIEEMKLKLKEAIEKYKTKTFSQKIKDMLQHVGKVIAKIDKLSATDRNGKSESPNSAKT